MQKSELRKYLKKKGIEIVNGMYVKKSDIQTILAEFYSIPKVPDTLKHGKTEREKEYLKIINDLMSLVQADPMTGLIHKEHFKSLEKSQGVYIMIDGDGLKAINDVHGHAAGHSAILAISDGIKAALRSKDDTTVTRAGGDEFIVHIEGISISAGVSVANRILDSIRKQKISTHYSGNKEVKDKLEKMKLTASLGVGHTEEEADKSLYDAKKKGRNRVEYQKALKAA